MTLSRGLELFCCAINRSCVVMLPVFAHQRNLKDIIQELISPLCPTFDISGVGVWVLWQRRKEEL
jgi:hypothetical protein